MKALPLIVLLIATTAPCKAKTAIRFIEDSRFREHELKQMLGDRLAHVEASAPSPSLADDAAFMMRELLVDAGYPNARVDWQITGANEMTLVIHSGQNMMLGEVRIQGAKVVDQARMVQLLKKPAMSNKKLVAQTVPYREADIETGISLIQQDLWAQGYWAAEVKIIETKPHPEQGKVDVAIEVKEGPLLRIGQTMVHCEQESITKRAMAQAAPYHQQIASTKNLDQIRVAVENDIKTAGYPDAVITMNRVPDEQSFIPEFTIQLGQRVTLHEVYVHGFQKTQPHRIYRRFKKMKGSWYDSTAFNKKVGELLSTGAFSGVKIEPTPYQPGQVDVHLTVEEAKSKEIRLGLGYGSFQGAISQFGYAERNLFGDLLGFSAGIELGSRQYLGEVKLTDPWFLGTDIISTSRAFSLVYRFDGYQVLDNGIEQKFSKKFGDHYAMELLGSIVQEEASSDGLPYGALGETSFLHPMIRLNHILDFRNNPVLPKSGWKVEHFLQVGSVMGELDNNYWIMGLSGGFHYELAPNWDLAIGGRSSMIDCSGEVYDLPINLRLFNGGSRSVRCFPEREMGPSIDGDPTGGLTTWSTNVEVIRSLSKNLKLVGFMDAGSTSEQKFDWAVQDMNIAVGLGVRFELPIGPVRLEYGHNLTQDPGEPSGAFFLAVGTAF